MGITDPTRYGRERVGLLDQFPGVEEFTLPGEGNKPLHIVKGKTFIATRRGLVFFQGTVLGVSHNVKGAYIGTGVTSCALAVVIDSFRGDFFHLSLPSRLILAKRFSMIFG
jgi:hypothetical protein